MHPGLTYHAVMHWRVLAGVPQNQFTLEGLYVATIINGTEPRTELTLACSV